MKRPLSYLTAAWSGEPDVDIDPGLMFLGNAVIQKQRQVQERADRGKARLISKAAVVVRQLHINIRLT